MKTGTMDVNSLPKTVTRQRPLGYRATQVECELNFTEYDHGYIRLQFTFEFYGTV